MLTGFSTGCLYKNLDPLSGEAIDMIASTGARLIEISTVLSSRLQALKELDPAELSAFEYVALHAPADIRYRDDATTRAVLATLAEACEKLDVRHVAFHPDTVEDWEVIDSSGLPAAFENMDKLKKFGGTFADMTEILSEDRVMILDLAHAYSNDPTMELARDLTERFEERIVAAHVSAYRKHEEDNQQHYPLSLANQEELLIPLPADIPIVIESVWPRLESPEELATGLAEELAYVIEKFRPQ